MSYEYGKDRYAVAEGFETQQRFSQDIIWIVVLGGHIFGIDDARPCKTGAFHVFENVGVIFIVSGRIGCVKFAVGVFHQNVSDLLFEFVHGHLLGNNGIGLAHEVLIEHTDFPFYKVC